MGEKTINKDNSKRKKIGLKKTIGIIAAISTISTTSIYASDIIIKVDNIVANFEVEPVTINGFTYISMNELNKNTGISIVYNDKTKSVISKSGNNEMEMFLGKTNAIINGVEKNIPVGPRYYQGYIVIPLRPLCEGLNIDINWNDNLKTISIDTEKNNLTVLDNNKDTNIEKNTITFNEALKLAINNNTSISSLDNSLKLLEESRKKAVQAYESSAIVGFDLQAIQALRSVLSIDNTTSNIPLNKEVIEKTTEYTLMNLVYAIDSYNMDLEILDRTIERGNRDLKEVKLKESLGFSSKKDVTTQQYTLNQLNRQKELLLIQLKSEKKALNNLLGVDLEKDINVLLNSSEEINEEKIYKISQYHYASSVIDSDPTIIMASKKIDEAEYALNTVVSSVNESKLEKENNYNEAVNNYENAKNKMNLAIYKAIDNGEILIENQNQTKENLDKAKNDYKNLTVNYSIGGITENELKYGELQIYKYEVEMKKNVEKFDILLFGLKNPFLL